MVTASDYYPFGMTMPSRKYSAGGGYRYGFNGKENDNSTGEGNLDFGARVMDVRLGRWLSLDPLQAKYPSESPYGFCNQNPLIYIDPDGKERIVVVGAEYRKWNLTFVLPGLKKIKELTSNSGESATILLFNTGYSAKQIAKIRKYARSQDATVVLVSSAKEVISYMNSKSLDGKIDMRKEDLISSVDVYSHGLPSSIELGYDTKLAAQGRIDKTSVSQINPEAFKTSAVINSNACRTGAANSNEEGKVEPEKSLAQMLATNLGVEVNAYLRRTEYENILPEDKSNLVGKLAHKIFNTGDKTYEKENGSWDTDDAIDKTKYPTSGTTPSKSKEGVVKFNKNNK